MEKNLKEHLKNIAILIKEIVLDELRPYTKSDVLSDSRVTVWNPEHGEIQAEVRLPFAMESFTSLPEFTTLIDDYKDVVDAYVPDMDTLQDIYHNVSYVFFYRRFLCGKILTLFSHYYVIQLRHRVTSLVT